ncbi:nicotinate-nucleotide adenylyltransferase [Methylophilaceae bacterium]|nr:nicotinate-nucleotide adenylyltransferase [Methylophilaceae bacterium]
MVNNKLIGLYGGAFDPVHKAHISIAQNCIKKIGLEKIIFVPTGYSPSGKILTAYHHRLEMLKIICKENYFEFSDFEIKKYINQKKISYTVDTLKYFKKNSDSTLFFILGTDAFSIINSWHKWNEILNYCHLLLIERDEKDSSIKKMLPEVQEFFKANITNNINNLKKNKYGKIYLISMPILDESSSKIRDRSVKNLDIKDLLPKTINDYINHNHLYKSPGHNK